MLLLKIIRWVLGYVRFSAAGREPERFLNLTAREGFRLWDIRKEDGIYRLCISRKEYRYLRGAARKAHIRLRVQERRGLPFLLKKWKGKRGLLYGAVAASIILIVLSTQVWIIDVHGNTTIDTHAIKEAAAEFGLKPGSWKRNLNPKALQHQLMSRFPEISWMSVNNQANRVTIDLREGVKSPEIEDANQVCNMISSMAGQIVRMEVYHGTIEVKIGDAVTSGQLLVNGITENQAGGYLFSHAAAKIMAKTRRTFAAEISLQQKKQEPTGETIVRRSMTFFGASLPLSLQGAPEGSYTRTLETSPLVLNGVELPLVVYTETFALQKERDVTLTKEEARQQALEQIQKQQEAVLKNPLEDGKVLSFIEEETMENGKYILKMNCVCEENIAVESEISLEQE